MFRFQKLDVWHEAVAYADRVYDAAQSFPDDERYGLQSQMRRASVSVSSNVAEGSGRVSDIDFARFLEIAYGSLMETASQAFIATRRGYMSESTRDDLCSHAEQLARMLSGLRASLLNKRPGS